MRILETTIDQADIKFLLSTQPHVKPLAIVRCVKGRLQHLVQHQIPQAFRRHFALLSLGDASRKTVETYVSKQALRHPMADPRAEEVLQEMSVANAEVDLSQPIRSSHGLYLVNLHLVLVHAERWRRLCVFSASAVVMVFLPGAVSYGQSVTRHSLATQFHALPDAHFSSAGRSAGVVFAPSNQTHRVHAFSPRFTTTGRVQGFRGTFVAPRGIVISPRRALRTPYGIADCAANLQQLAGLDVVKERHLDRWPSLR